MAADQGKTSNLNGLAILAGARGLPIPAVGTTRFRPPYNPVSLGALAGQSRGAHLQPLRRTPLHDWHIKAGGEMMNVGLWQRPRAYRRAGETLEQAYVREARAVRASVGIADVSTLGKIDVQGPDAALFLDRVYTNTFSTLAVGKARYGLMLRDDGFRLRRRHDLAALRHALPDDHDDGQWRARLCRIWKCCWRSPGRS